MKTKSEKMLLAFKIIGTVIYAVMTLLLAYIFIDALPSNQEVANGQIDLTGLGFALTIIIFSAVGFFVYLVPTILGIIGAITSKRLSKGINNTIYFSVMASLPMITEILFFCTLFFVEG